MSTNLPTLDLPRTPSPTSSDGQATDFGDEIVQTHPYGQYAYPSKSSLSPYNFHNSTSSLASGPYKYTDSTTSLGLSPMSAEVVGTPPTSSDGSKNPFGFKPQTYLPNQPAPVLGKRRGHKYKHSSVSHQIFLEPTPRAPLRLPASLPIPTIREGYHSMSREQSTRVIWCFCHLFVAAYVQWMAQGSLALTALSHLIFYDAVGAFLCAGVEILSNFEVWRCGSIRQPFGLERSEVLAGFAMSIMLMFMGFDLISHSVSHALEDVGSHEAHRAHKHERVSPGSVDLVSLLAICSTLVSAFMLQNHSRIARAIRPGHVSFSFLPQVLNNPSHLLTLSCSMALLLMPLLSFNMYTWMDGALSTIMAVSMCWLGYRLVRTLGAMLLMSSSSDVSGVLDDIKTDPTVLAVDEFSLWDVHYRLSMANLKNPRSSGQGRFLITTPGAYHEPNQEQARWRIWHRRDHLGG